MKNIALIGSTGSIGRQVLNVVRAHPDMFSVCALVANSPSAEFLSQLSEFRPAYSALASTEPDRALHAAELEEADVVFNAAGGFAGLAYSLRAVRAGKELALANKETLVCGGDVVLGEALKSGSEILPVDSEHSAIWQCMNFDKKKRVRRLIITASGGAFRGYTPEMLKSVTPEQALAHPTWRMGKKITVDSATLMNKGLELIEAMHLFSVKRENIKIIVQRESIIHSAVEFEDGAVVAQLGIPDMSIPIQYAFTCPERAATETPPLELEKIGSLSFSVPDRNTFKCLALAERAADAGGAACAALNAANEVAVGRFLAGKLSFPGIAETVERLSEGYSGDASPERALEIDAEVRSRAAGGRG